MSINLGNGFSGKTEEGKQYITLALDESILALFPLLSMVTIKLWYVPQDERRSEKSPGWRLVLAIKKNREEKPASDTNTVSEEDIPF